MMPDVKIIVMDLEMWKSQMIQMQRLHNVEVVSFPFEAFPQHVKKLDTLKAFINTNDVGEI